MADTEVKKVSESCGGHIERAYGSTGIAARSQDTPQQKAAGRRKKEVSLLCLTNSK